jgi:hypothetical protein
VWSDGKPIVSGLTLQRAPHAPRGIRMPNVQTSFFLPDSLRYDRAQIGDATLSTTFTDDPTGAPTWIQVHVSGHLGRPAGIGYRVVALTPTGAVRCGTNLHVDSLIGLCIVRKRAVPA